MYERHWGFARQPFAGDIDPARYYANPMHDEGLARLQYLVQQRRRLGLLTGEAGTGKSMLLTVLADRLTRDHLPVVQLNLTAVEPAEFPWLLAAGLGLNPRDTDSPVKLWRLIADRVAENRYQQRSTTFLFDDADQAPVALAASLLRLTQCDPSPAARLTLVLATDPEATASLPQRLLDLTELRIELEMWDEATTAGYLSAQLSLAGGPTQVVEPRAAERIQQLCHGNPRRINHLADLAMAASAGLKHTTLDAATVDAVYDELVGIDVAHAVV